VKIEIYEYDVDTNSSLVILDDLNEIPIRYVNGSMVYLRDVAFVLDGFQPQTNLVRRDGRHSVPAAHPEQRQRVDPVGGGWGAAADAQDSGWPAVEPLFDQSIFVRAAITGVLREGAIAGCLTALMILLFLGSWRSILIVATSIPLAILSSIIVLDLLGSR
jgi:multidrug efflux pump subunit AcrB